MLNHNHIFKIIKKIIIKINYLIKNNYFIILWNNKILKKDVKIIFKNIYKKKIWTPSNLQNKYKFYSGTGSHTDDLITIYLDSVKKFLMSLKKKPNVIDLGCGDFAVGVKLRNYCDKYFAIDIYDELIEYNKTKYMDLNIDFRTLDITKDNLPDANVCILRQVLQHLSNESIIKFIKNINSKYQYIILTEHYPDKKKFTPNIDKFDGSDIRLINNSAVVLEEAPFKLNFVKKIELCNLKSKKIINFEGYLNTKVLQLF